MKKEWSGERLETFVINETMIEHLHRYSIALPIVTNKIVLDIASGEGYGSNLLSAMAYHIYGVDIDQHTIEAAKQKYPSKNITFLHGSADKIPLSDKTVDVVVSFETIEHHDNHTAMLIEIKRVLKPGGVLIMSSPNKKYYSDETGFKNPFHIKELYLEEFKKLINTYFTNTYYYNQRFISGSIILAENRTEDFQIHSGRYNSLNRPIKFTPVYNLVIASDDMIILPADSLFKSDQLLNAIRMEVIKQYTSTFTWKIGRTFIAPLTYLKQIFNNWYH